MPRGDVSKRGKCYCGAAAQEGSAFCRRYPLCARGRSFLLDVPGGGVAMVHGDPKMSAKSRKALGEVVRVAYDAMTKRPKARDLVTIVESRHQHRGFSTWQFEYATRVLPEDLVLGPDRRAGIEKVRP